MQANFKIVLFTKGLKDTVTYFMLIKLFINLSLRHATTEDKRINSISVA